MPALSFQREWLDALLRGDKQQTTRPLTDRFKVGGIVHAYIEQRRRITDKPLRNCTKNGKWNIRELMNKRSHYPQVFYDRWGDVFYPHRLDWESGSPRYHAHFIGKVEVTEVSPFKPSAHKGHGGILFREMWAKADGFSSFDTTDVHGDVVHISANDWFRMRYGDDWMQKTWTVIRWQGWEERYFEPKEVIL